MGCCGFECLLPIRGLAGFFSSPDLQALVVVPFLLLLVATVASLVLLLLFAFKPQVRFVERARVPAWLSDIMVVLMILLEVLLVSSILVKVIFDKVVKDITYRVLEKRGVISRLRKFGIERIGDVECCLGTVAIQVLFAITRLTLVLITLPLNDLPVLGTVLWLLVNGWIYSWELISDLLPAFGFTDCCGQTSYAISHRLEFGTFGATAMALTLIPFVGPLFMFTNAYGAALLFEALLDQREGSPDGYSRLE